MSDQVTVIHGSRALPPGFDHPHASEEARAVAEQGTVQVAEHGYDTKFGMHALRLCAQGVELLTTGWVTLPVPEPLREHLRALRRSEVPLEEVTEAVDAAERRLRELADSPRLPEEPDRAWVDDWLQRSYLSAWVRWAERQVRAVRSSSSYSASTSSPRSAIRPSVCTCHTS